MLFYATTIDGLQMGLCFAVLALGIYISYSILDFPDLSVDGTFPLGGVCCTLFMLRLGLPPVAATVLSFAVGFAAGCVTGVLHVRFKISKLLSGIIVMTGLLSVTLALTKLLTKNGQTTTIFSFRSENLTGLFGGKLLANMSADARDYAILGILLVAALLVKLLLDVFMKTYLGYMLKATGNNEQLVVSLGRDVGRYKILGLALGTFFDYYVTYVVSAEVGMIQRWFERGLTESPEAMARIMTVLAFVRPGDLYGQPIDINVPEYGMKLLNLQLEDAADTAATVESNN